ncbi:MAG TPA: RMD1 family protein [Novosphingobium sp.]
MADHPEVPLLTGSPDVVALGRLPDERRLVAVARLLGVRIRTRELAAALAEDPAFAGAAQAAGLAFVFRYGAVVGFGSAGLRPDLLDAMLAPFVDEPVGVPELETANLAVREGAAEDRVEPDGLIVLSGADAPRLELVATVLSRSVVLARDEVLVSQAFDRSAPLVAELRGAGRVRLPIRSVMRMVGEALAARHRVTGAAQVDERPDLLWDHPALDRLYARLEGEYELSERAEALNDKLDALGDFAEALLDIVQDKRAVRLEVAIIALIAFEIVLNLWEKLTG